MNNEIVGTLENWEIQRFTDGYAIWGNIYGDVNGRFQDGTLVRTSLVTKMLKEDTAITLNSIYKLGKKYETL